MEIKDNIFKLLRELFMLQIKESLFQQELAEKLNLSRRDPRFRDILKVLRDNDLVKEETMIHTIKKIKVNNNKLDKFIRFNSEEFKRWGLYIEISKPGVYNY
jgi:hypothetical protein